VNGAADRMRELGPVLLLAGLAALLWLGNRSAGLGRLEATAIALTLPMLVLAFATAPAWHRTARRLRIAIAVVVLSVAVLSELSLLDVLFPPAPLATATLDPAHGDRSLALPATSQDLRVTIRGELPGTAPTQAVFAITLQRDGAPNSLSGTLERTIHHNRSRRGPPGTVTTTRDSITEELRLAGTGPLRVHLDQLEGQVTGGLRLELRKARLLDGPASALLAGLALVAVLLQGVAARHRPVPALAAAVCAAATFTVVATTYYVPERPLSLMLGAAGAGLCAMIPGWLGGLLATALLRRRTATTAAFRSDAVDPTRTG
jgi:hypothetical protein